MFSTRCENISKPTLTLRENDRDEDGEGWGVGVGLKTGKQCKN
jgi:hypothetical protein